MEWPTEIITLVHINIESKYLCNAGEKHLRAIANKVDFPPPGWGTTVARSI